MKKEKSINIATIISVFIIFAIAMIYVTIYIFNYPTNTDNYFKSYNKKINNELGKQLNNQKEIDKKIEDISINGGYTFDEPCVLQNPYNISPLSALIIFNTTEETSIRVSINDELVTTIEKSKKHLIPIYGLYANSSNIVTLTDDFGQTKEINIKTESLNEYIKEYAVEDALNGKSHLFMLGDLKSSSSYLRGFDSNNNLIFYLQFGNISAANFYSNNLYISYNSQHLEMNNSKNLKLELDYLGRIYSISISTKDLTNTSNLTLENEEYLATPVNLYKKEIKNYKITDVVDTITSTETSVLNTSSIDEQLTNAKTYDKEYVLAVNGNYITYEFLEEDIELLLVTKNTDYTYSYKLTDKNIFKTDVSGEVSFYIISDGIYYTLLSTTSF